MAVHASAFPVSPHVEEGARRLFEKGWCSKIEPS